MRALSATCPEVEVVVVGDALEAPFTWLAERRLDVALAGIGENGHLAFNDPPADFETDKPYLVVELDEACRRQQLNEGWFSSLGSVPMKAISMSIKQIMKSKNIICSVPDKRKAQAVKDCVEKPVSNMHPASVLQRHPSCYLYLDEASASLLEHAEKIAVK
jgi:glucosamine-6-phosphate deaminase